MITRAQAEALLTLAESLEACERLNIGLSHHSAGMTLGPDDNIECILPDSTSIQLRLAVNALIPKQET